MTSPPDRPRTGDRRPQTVVFDLDGTLVAGDSFGAFLRHLITGRFLRCAAAVLTAPLWVPAILLPPTRLTAQRYMVWVAAVGMDEHAFTTAAADFATRHAGPTSGRSAAAALARVRDHQASGDRVIIATGCAAVLAHPVCAVLGLTEVEVVASTLTYRRWRLPHPVRSARGSGKLQALHAAGVEFPVDHAYSDSATDLPLLRAARTAHVVDPTPRNWFRLHRALGPDVDLLHWAEPTPP